MPNANTQPPPISNAQEAELWSQVYSRTAETLVAKLAAERPPQSGDVPKAIDYVSLNAADYADRAVAELRLRTADGIEDLDW